MAKLLTLRNRRPQEIAIIMYKVKTTSTSSLLSVAACPNTTTTTTTSEYLQKEKNVLKREPERVSLLKEDFAGYLRVQLFRMHGEKFGTETRTFCLRAFYTNVLPTTYKLSTLACNITQF